MLRASSLAHHLPTQALAKQKLQARQWRTVRFFSNTRLRQPLPLPQSLEKEMESQIEKDHEEEDLSEGLYITQKVGTYAAGKPWRRLPVPPVIPPENPSDDAHCMKPSQTMAARRYATFEQLKERNVHLRVLGTTNSTDVAWDAYMSILTLPRPEYSRRKIPLPFLYRFTYLLAREIPPTRVVFLRMISVLFAIRKAGGRLQQVHWNALIKAAGKGSGLRQTNPEDYRLALEVFADMLSGKAPGETFVLTNPSAFEMVHDYPSLKAQDAVNVGVSHSVKPNIVTYTTLISIAARTLRQDFIQQATSLLQQSGLPPNRITHLSLLRYFSATKQYRGIQTTIQKMNEQKLELGLDGLNACMWGYARTDRVDIVVKVYRLLRYNSGCVPEEALHSDLRAFATQLEKEEHIYIPPDLIPNDITFTLVIQILAYAGDLRGALGVFSDFLTTQNLEVGAPLARQTSDRLVPVNYGPSVAIYRAIFLGFARHGTPPRSTHNPLPEDGWTYANIQLLFGTFIKLPKDMGLCSQTIYWIIAGFSKTTDNNVEVLKKVWKLLEAKYPGPWGGEEHRLVRIRDSLFPDGRGTRRP